MGWAEFVLTAISVERSLQQAGKLEWMNDWWMTIIEPGHFISYYASKWTGAGYEKSPEAIDSPTYAGDSPVLTAHLGGIVPSATGIVYVAGNVVRQNDVKDATNIDIIVDYGEGAWDEILATYVNDVEWNDLKGGHSKFEHLGAVNQSGVTNLFTEDACNYRNHVVVEYKFIKGDEITQLQNITVVARTRKCLEIGQDVGGTESFARNPAQILWDFYLKKKDVSLSELNENAFNSLKSYCEASLCYSDKTYYPVNVLAPSQDLVKATTSNTAYGFYSSFPVDQNNASAGAAAYNCWESTSNIEQRINFDFGRKVVITRIEISNYHDSGADTDVGIKAFIFQGTNDPAIFVDVSYAAVWTNVKEALQAAEHTAVDEPDWQTFDITPHVTGYRYYSVKIANNWGDVNKMGIRQIRFFTGNASGECTGDETNIRYAFDFNNDTRIDLNDYEKMIWQSFNGMIVKDQGVYKPVWDGAQEADGAGGLQTKANKHTFTVSTNVVEKTLSWHRLDYANFYIISSLDSTNKFRKNSNATLKNDSDIGARGEVTNEESCWWLIDYILAARRCKFKYNKGQYLDYTGQLTGFPDSQALEIFDRVAVTDTQAGWTAKDFIIIEKDEDQYGRSTFILESYLSGIYEDKGFEIQPNYTTAFVNPNAPIQSGSYTGVSISIIAGIVGNRYSKSPLRVQFTPPSFSTYLHSEIWLSINDSDYYLAGTDSDGDAYIDGLGKFWDFGDTIYAKVVHWTTMGIGGSFPATAQASVAANTSVVKSAGFYYGQYDFWGGNAALGNAATTIVLGNLDGVSKIALGATADSLTLINMATYPGFYADGAGNFRAGGSGQYVSWDGTTLNVAGVITVTGGSGIGVKNQLFNGNFEDWTAGTTSAPDNWAISGAGASIAREATIIKIGTYSGKLTRAGTNCYILQNIHAEKGIAYWQGRAATFSCWIYATSANQARIRISDGVSAGTSSYHTGDSTWQLLSVTYTINAAATIVSPNIQNVTTDSAIYFDGAMYVEGSLAMPFEDNILGLQSGLHANLTASYLGFYNSSTLLSSMSGTEIALYGAGTKTLSLVSGAAYIGDQSNEHLKLSSTGLEAKDGATVLSTFDANGHHNDIQPSFLIIADGVSDVTGDNTLYTVVFANEIFDKASDVTTTTFTAPCAGRYIFQIQLYLGNLLNTHASGSMLLVTSNRNYNKFIRYINSTSDSFNITVLADMDLGDTAYVTIQIEGGTKVVDITATSTYFSGELLG